MMMSDSEPKWARSVDDLPEIKRRQIIKWALKGTGITAAIVALNEASSLIQGKKTDPALEQLYNESVHALETNAPLETKYFAFDIVGTAVKNRGGLENAALVSAVIGFWSGTTLGGYFLRKAGKKINGMVGAASAATGKTVDTISTIIGLSHTSDPRLKEYGLDKLFAEQNLFFSPLPSRDELLIKGGIMAVLFSFSGYFWPSMARGYLGSIPFIASFNYETGYLMGRSIELGDQVKALISEGKSAQDIKAYLASLEG